MARRMFGEIVNLLRPEPSGPESVESQTHWCKPTGRRLQQSTGCEDITRRWPFYSKPLEEEQGRRMKICSGLDSRAEGEQGIGWDPSGGPDQDLATWGEVKDSITTDLKSLFAWLIRPNNRRTEVDAPSDLPQIAVRDLPPSHQPPVRVIGHVVDPLPLKVVWSEIKLLVANHDHETSSEEDCEWSSRQDTSQPPDTMQVTTATGSGLVDITLDASHAPKAPEVTEDTQEDKSLWTLLEFVPHDGDFQTSGTLEQHRSIKSVSFSPSSPRQTDDADYEDVTPLSFRSMSSDEVEREFHVVASQFERDGRHQESHDETEEKTPYHLRVQASDTSFCLDRNWQQQTEKNKELIKSFCPFVDTPQSLLGESPAKYQAHVVDRVASVQIGVEHNKEELVNEQLIEVTTRGETAVVEADTSSIFETPRRHRTFCGALGSLRSSFHSGSTEREQETTDSNLKNNNLWQRRQSENLKSHSTNAKNSEKPRVSFSNFTRRGSGSMECRSESRLQMARASMEQVTSLRRKQQSSPAGPVRSGSLLAAKPIVESETIRQYIEEVRLADPKAAEEIETVFENRVESVLGKKGPFALFFKPRLVVLHQFALKDFVMPYDPKEEPETLDLYNRFYTVHSTNENVFQLKIEGGRGLNFSVPPYSPYTRDHWVSQVKKTLDAVKLLHQLRERTLHKQASVYTKQRSLQRRQK